MIANVAINALVALSAIDAPLAAVKGPSDEIAAGALRVLQQIHQPAVVTGLIAALPDAPPARRGAILQALARLHNREGVWRGTLAEWWGTRPDTTGPYYDPVAWEESARIRSVLLDALLESAAGAGPRPDFTRLASDLQRNRVLPPGGEALLSALGIDRHALFGDVARALVGKVRLDVDSTTGQLLDAIAARADRYRAAVVRMVVAAGPPTPPPAPSSFQRRSIEHWTLRCVRPRCPRSCPPVPRPSVDPSTRSRVWSRQRSSRRSNRSGRNSSRRRRTPRTSLTWRALVEGNDPTRQRLGFAVLLQLAADPPAARGGARRRSRRWRRPGTRRNHSGSRRSRARRGSRDHRRCLDESGGGESRLGGGTYRRGAVPRSRRCPS